MDRVTAPTFNHSNSIGSIIKKVLRELHKKYNRCNKRPSKKPSETCERSILLKRWGGVMVPTIPLKENELTHLIQGGWYNLQLFRYIYIHPQIVDFCSSPKSCSVAYNYLVVC